MSPKSPSLNSEPCLEPGNGAPSPPGEVQIPSGSPWASRSVPCSTPSPTSSLIIPPRLCRSWLHRIYQLGRSQGNTRHSLSFRGGNLSTTRGETGDVEATRTNNFRKAPEHPGLKGQMGEMVLEPGPPSGNGNLPERPPCGSWDHGEGTELMLVV